MTDWDKAELRRGLLAVAACVLDYQFRQIDADYFRCPEFTSVAARTGRREWEPRAEVPERVANAINDLIAALAAARDQQPAEVPA